MKLHYTDSRGPEVPALEAALVEAASLAASNGYGEAAIAVHTKTNLTGILSNVLGESAIKQLQGGKVDINGVDFFLLTEQIEAPSFDEGPILAAHVSLEYLDEVMQDSRATDVIYVPWAQKEKQDFISSNPDANRIDH